MHRRLGPRRPRLGLLRQYSSLSYSLTTVLSISGGASKSVKSKVRVSATLTKSYSAG